MKTLFIFALFLFSSYTSAAVWVPQASGGSSGGGSSCYHITFNAGTYGTRSLIGSGTVAGSYFTGFMWWPGLQRGTARNDCGSGAVGQCAWSYAYGSAGYSSNSYSVAVSALPIASAQPTGCY